MRPTLSADWHLHPNVEANATVHRAEIDIPLGTISVRTQAQRAVNRLVGRLQSRLNERIGNDDSLAELGRKLWESSHRTLNVATEPPTWIVLIPARVGATPVRSNDEGVGFKVFVAGSTAVVIGEQPARQALGDLPELHISEEQSEGEIELAVPVFAEWEVLDSAIANQVRTRPVVYEGRSGVLTVHEISVSGGEGGALLVSAVDLRPVTRLSSLAVEADGLRVNVCAGADIDAQLHPLDL